MSYWDRSRLEDGDTLTPAAWSADVDAATTAINNLDDDNIQHHAFNEAHIGSLVGLLPDEGDWVVNGDGGAHTYTGTNATWGANLIAYAEPGSYGGGDGSGALSTADRVLIGNASVDGGYSGDPARLTWTSGLYLGMTRASHVGAIFLSLNLCVDSFDLDAATTFIVMVCFQFQIDSGTWYTIDRSERHISLDEMRNGLEPVNFDIPLRCFLRESDVDLVADPAVNKVTGVRAMIAIVDGTSGQSVTCRRFTFSAIPLHVEVVT